MPRKPKPRPSFFKVLTHHDFTRRLTIPPYFVRKHRDTLPKHAKVRSSSGETWDVKIEETDNGKHYFTRGWSKFVKDLGLEFGEFMLLWFDIDKSTFEVSVFGIHGCEKEIIRCKSEPDDDAAELSEDGKNMINESLSNKEFVANEAAAASKKTGNGAKCDESSPRFEIVLKEHQKSRLTLPKKFGEKAGLIGERGVVVKYLPKKPHWAVLLEQSPNNYRWFKLVLGWGWSKFCRTNGLICGKTYSFTFNPVENVIQVEPVYTK